MHVGSNSDRQSIGLPGHCDACAEHGHVVAHPHLGCADVGCSASHEPRLAGVPRRTPGHQEVVVQLREGVALVKPRPRVIQDKCNGCQDEDATVTIVLGRTMGLHTSLCTTCASVIGHGLLHHSEDPTWLDTAGTVQ